MITIFFMVRCKLVFTHRSYMLFEVLKRINTVIKIKKKNFMFINSANDQQNTTPMTNHK